KFAVAQLVEQMHARKGSTGSIVPRRLYLLCFTRAGEHSSSARVGRGGGEDFCYFVERAWAAKAFPRAGSTPAGCNSVGPKGQYRVACSPLAQYPSNSNPRKEAIMKLNKLFRPRTHEGARAVAFLPEQQLKRALMNCLLWEDQFYEDGVSIA